MPIHFRNTPANEPFLFDSIGNRWNQSFVLRQEGYPLYHYLQTESGRGIVKVRGEEYILNEGEGLLTAPFIPHSYTKDSPDWIPLFAALPGLSTAASFPSPAIVPSCSSTGNGD